MVALMIGISSLERHITLDRSMYGRPVASLESSGKKFLSEEKMLLAIGKPSMGEIIDAELPIAKIKSSYKLSNLVKNKNNLEEQLQKTFKYLDFRF